MGERREDSLRDKMEEMQESIIVLKDSTLKLREDLSEVVKKLQESVVLLKRIKSSSVEERVNIK